MMDRVRDAVLLSGADDWVMAGEFVAAARNVAQDRHIATTLALGVIREMLESGVIEAGDVLENDGFVPWGLEPAESADRIEQAWRDLGREPSMGDICWFNLTARGEVEAEAVFSRRENRPL